MTTEPARKIIILGALSAMAAATARRLAEGGASLTLSGRTGEALERDAQDLRARGASHVSTLVADLADTSDCDALLMRASEAMGGLDTVLVFYGSLGDQSRAEQEPAHADAIITINYSSTVHWVLAAARVLEKTAGARGVLLTASSVAGDRGRRSNYVYGSAKAGLSVLMQGLAHKWAAMDNAPSAVNLRLGFVETPMTDGIENRGGPLWAKPDDIAGIVVRRLEKPGHPTVYAPWFWRCIMVIIRALPTAIFNKVNI
ncbi:MAG: SDR family NAD(P)-dependent oxidoreductase [Caulobacterales bacterium]|uniref:SDR family NAD(P)-dependent oxidoreductase n=1 Tax=Glycocaulis sp. TaxID=1969725 RepID=UPI003FA02743